MELSQELNTLLSALGVLLPVFSMYLTQAAKRLGLKKDLDLSGPGLARATAVGLFGLMILSGVQLLPGAYEALPAAPDAFSLLDWAIHNLGISVIQLTYISEGSRALYDKYLKRPPATA